MTVTSYELPKDFEVQVRTLHRAEVALGRTESNDSSGRPVIIRAIITVAWIERFGIMHSEVRLDKASKEVYEALDGLVGDAVKIVPHIFDATREALTLVDDTTMQLHTRAAEVEDLILPLRG